MKLIDVIIIGAGPAGLLAAGRAAELGASVVILEKMRSPGRKLLITGKGRCNITNDAAIGEFITHVFPNGKFLRNAFSKFYSNDIIELLHRYGVESVLERGGRYFPASDKSQHVLKALLQWVKESGVEIRSGERVEKLIAENAIIKGVKSNGREIYAPKVILATGGKSYPATGSTGEGYELARQVGHTIEKPIPALVPLETIGNVAQELQGLNLRNVNAVLWVDNKKAGEAFGEMLFTHFGLSGPIILTLSRFAVTPLHNHQKVEISIDLKPSFTDESLDQRLIRNLNEHGKMLIGNIFRHWLPTSMIPIFLEQLEIDSSKECHQISGKERKQIRNMMKNFRFEISHNRSFKEAIITAGGVITSEISPKTMESKLCRGLFLAGEVIDLDAETGGYNLQIAYSTGWLAGNSAANKINHN